MERSIEIDLPRSGDLYERFQVKSAEQLIKSENTLISLGEKINNEKAVPLIL